MKVIKINPDTKKFEVVHQFEITHTSVNENGLQVGAPDEQIVDIAPDELKAIINIIKTKPHLVRMYV